MQNNCKALSYYLQNKNKIEITPVANDKNHVVYTWLYVNISINYGCQLINNEFPCLIINR